MRAIRTVLFMTWLVLVTAVLGILALPTMLLPRAVTWVFYNLWVDLILGGFECIIGVAVEWRGLENLPEGPALIAAKHQAMWDTVAVFRLLRHPAIILKQELIWIPIYGWYAAKLGMIPVDRSAHASALRRMVTRAKARLAENRSIVIFPEGTRVAPGTKLDYKPGVAALYRQLDVPCVPIALNSGRSWPGRGYGFKPGKITLEVLDPIQPGLQRKAFMVALEERIETASTRLASE